MQVETGVGHLQTKEILGLPESPEAWKWAIEQIDSLSEPLEGSSSADILI